MISIRKSGVVNANINSVWKVLLDEEKESSYWKEIRNIVVKSRSGNTIEREAIVGPRLFGLKTHQVVTMFPKTRILLRFAGEQVTGQRDVELNQDGSETQINVSWELELKEVPDFVQGIVQNQISKVTEGAIEMIAAAAVSDGM